MKKNNKNKLVNNQKLVNLFFSVFLFVTFMLNHKSWAEVYGNIVYIVALVFVVLIILVQILRRRKNKKRED